MTFSIIARDEATGCFGIAVASKFLAAGARTIFARTGVGAIASQSLFNPFYGPRGLALLAAGASAADTVRLLTAADEGHHLRQLHVMDHDGRFAAHTGSECAEWSGHLCRETFSVAGNTLADENVLKAMVASYEGNGLMPFARRLIAAMQAGEDAGGDARGRQAAALLVHDREEYSLLDLRVDDHPDPLDEIARLEEVARRSWVHFRLVLPSAKNPHGVLDSQAAQAKIEASMAEGRD